MTTKVTTRREWRRPVVPGGRQTSLYLATPQAIAAGAYDIVQFDSVEAGSWANAGAITTDLGELAAGAGITIPVAGDYTLNGEVLFESDDGLPGAHAELDLWYWDPVGEVSVFLAGMEIEGNGSETKGTSRATYRVSLAAGVTVFAVMYNATADAGTISGPAPKGFLQAWS